jgi:HAMP domain-containing protein
MSMKLLVQINLALGGVLILSAWGLGYACAQMLNASARQELIQQAALIMDGAVATRDYTTEEILPLLDTAMKTDFPPQSVPFYAATQNFLKVHARHPEYSYKEATLNPTNLRDRAMDWESDLIQQFRNNGQSSEIIGERDTPLGRTLYMARPIRVEPQCLACHSTAQAAPATLLARYGSANGFGWQPNEIVAAQVVSVPLNAATVNTHRTLYRIVTAISASFVLLLLITNALLYWLVIRPLRQMTLVADLLSRGEAARATFATQGAQEIAAVARAFERLRISLEKAMQRLQS